MPTEAELIEAFVSAFPRAPPPLGPGDDCALIPRPRRRECVTTDALVEGVHFTRAQFTPEDVGHKALAVNLSDLASMGARPSWFVCALALPKAVTRGYVVRLARGMSRLARVHRVRLVGGNFTRADELSVTITAAGLAPPRPLLRSGARAGDLLYVSGTLGDARMGLLQLGTPRASPRLASRQKRPQPRLALGLLASRFASGCIDLSDGLAQDLGQLCRSSGVGAEVELERLPLSPELVRAAGGVGPARWHALAGGEDYELLLSVSPRRAGALEREVRRLSPLTCIGVCVRGNSPRILRAGRAVRARPGFRHFR
ncbi:MAG: thiamine-phosphate kinase [Myxococcales bacterium]|nr:thiamine-phosphate kinase [Myxococcales bacterium]